MTTKNKPIINVVIENEQPVTTSRNIAEVFGRNHQHVLEAIDNLTVENSTVKKMFSEDVYTNTRGRRYRQVLMNRDGFSLLAMGFSNTERVLEWKLKYIEQFNKMEEQIKNQIDTSQLSPELQMFNQMFKALSNQEVKTKQLENKVDGIADLMQMNTEDWRKEVTSIIRKIAARQGGYEKYQEIGNESYTRLESKGRCNLDIRLENRRKNMIVQGVGKTAVKRLNKLDIIEDDHRLKQIYVSVVKDMAIKYGVWEE